MGFNASSLGGAFTGGTDADQQKQAAAGTIKGNMEKDDQNPASWPEPIEGRLDQEEVELITNMWREEGRSDEYIKYQLSRTVIIGGDGTLGIAPTEEKSIPTGDPNREITVTSFLTPFVGGRVAELADEAVQAAQKKIQQIAAAVRNWWEYDTIQTRATPPPPDNAQYRNRPKIEIHQIADIEGFGSIDKQASILGYYDGFILTAVSVSDVEKVDVIETFGAPHIFASGTFVKKVNVSGLVRAYAVTEFNKPDAPRELVVSDYVKMRRFYEKYLRTTRMAENGTIARLVVDNETYEGFFTNFNLNRDAQMEQVIPWSASMLVVNHTHAQDAEADGVLATKIKQPDPEDQAIPLDRAYAELADAEGTLDIFTAANPQVAAGKGKYGRLVTGELDYDHPQRPLVSNTAHPVAAIFGKGAGASKLSVKLLGGLTGVTLVGQAYGGGDPSRGVPLENVTISGHDETVPLVLSYRITNYQEMVNSAFDAGVEEKDGRLEFTAQFEVLPRISGDNVPVKVDLVMNVAVEAPFSVVATVELEAQSGRKVALTTHTPTPYSTEFSGVLNPDASSLIYDVEGRVPLRITLQFFDRKNRSTPLKLPADAFRPTSSVFFEGFDVAVSTTSGTRTLAQVKGVGKFDDRKLVRAATGADTPKYQGEVYRPDQPTDFDTSRLESDGIISFKTYTQLAKTKEGEPITWRETGSVFEYHKFWNWNMDLTLLFRGLQRSSIKFNLTAKADSPQSRLYNLVKYLVPRGLSGFARAGEKTSVADFDTPGQNWAQWLPTADGSDPHSFVLYFEAFLRDGETQIPPEIANDIERVSFTFHKKPSVEGYLEFTGYRIKSGYADEDSIFINQTSRATHRTLEHIAGTRLFRARYSVPSRALFGDPLKRYVSKVNKVTFSLPVNVIMAELPTVKAGVDLQG